MGQGKGVLEFGDIKGFIVIGLDFFVFLDLVMIVVYLGNAE